MRLPAEHLPHAACIGIDTAVFYPRSYRLDSKRGPELAIAICETCPVQTPCLDAGLDEPEGIWAGTTPDDRRHLRKGNP